MSSTPISVRPACLVVIDGWGVSLPAPAPASSDAISAARTPTMSALAGTHPNTPLAAHGLAVGLPDGLMGNSEVGHLNIGAGRVVFQDIVRIDLACNNDGFGDTETVKDFMASAGAGAGRLHLMGLVSDGGVHSHIRHLFGLMRAAKRANIPECWVHVFTDGRDTPPASATKYIRELLDFMREIGYGKIATICGRYYAMDRDQRWERIQVAASAILCGTTPEGTPLHVAADPIAAVEARYAEKEFDEFLRPILCAPATETCLRDGDVVFMFDYRADRMREIAQVIGQISPGCDKVNAAVPKNLSIMTMTSYKAEFPFKLAFPPQTHDNVLAEHLSKRSIPQCHVAETEKYAHVTFFFNGGREVQYSGETRRMLPSPKVATYDLAPAMAAHEVAQTVIEEIHSKTSPFIMCNFAPPDMVGHTGVYEAAIQACEATDTAIGNIWTACQEAGYALFVTSDHGNAEKMRDEITGQPHTAHTTSLVPFIMAVPKSVTEYSSFGLKKAVDGEDRVPALCDAAPTVLAYMGLDQPKEMTGKSLLESSK